VVPNAVFFHEAYESYRRTSQIERADLAALEITRPRVVLGFRIEEEDADTGYVPVEANAYFETRDEDGSPAYDEAELAAAPEHARVPGDKVMAAALGLELAPGQMGRSCHPAPIDEGSLVLPLDRGGAELQATKPLQLALGRFSESFPVALGELVPDTWVELRIPPDLSPQPWKLQVSGEGQLTICRVAGA